LCEEGAGELTEVVVERERREKDEEKKRKAKRTSKKSARKTVISHNPDSVKLQRKQGVGVGLSVHIFCFSSLQPI